MFSNNDFTLFVENDGFSNDEIKFKVRVNVDRQNNVFDEICKVTM